MLGCGVGGVEEMTGFRASGLGGLGGLSLGPGVQGFRTLGFGDFVFRGLGLGPARV